MLTEDEEMAERIAKAETEAAVQGYKMVPYPGDVPRWRLTGTFNDEWVELGPFNIDQVEEEIFGHQGVKSELRGGSGEDGSIVRPSIAK